MGFLLDNIRQQSVAMCQMNKKPVKLVCDIDSWNALVDELAPSLSLLYPHESGPTRIYGLEVELSSEPNFEVC